MTEQCKCLVHPDGFNGELPRVGQVGSWVPCSEPVVVLLSNGWHDPIPVCERHRKLIEGIE